MAEGSPRGSTTSSGELVMNNRGMEIKDSVKKSVWFQEEPASQNAECE